MPKPKHRIWIELDKPTSPEDAEEKCRLANIVLARLGFDSGGAAFYYDKNHRTYCLNLSNHAGFIELNDNGHWFYIDHIEKPSTAEQLLEALELALRLCDEALPKFNWGASALDANAIELLNRTPLVLRAAIAEVKEATK